MSKKLENIISRGIARACLKIHSRTVGAIMVGALSFAAVFNPGPLLLHAQESEEETSFTTAAGDPFQYAQSYEAIYQALQNYVNIYDTYDAGYGNFPRVTAEYSVAEDIAVDTAASVSADVDFSQTNLVEQGVDESDIVKTDGTYIYVLRSDLTLDIFKADGADSQLISSTSIEAGADSYARGMYLDGDTLSIVLSEYVSSLANDDYVYYADSYYQSRLITWDISDPAALREMGSVIQDGLYRDSRKVGRYIYLFTSWTPDIQDTYEGSRIAPQVNGTEVPAGSFYLPDELRSSTCLVISSMDISEPQSILDTKVLVSGADSFYASQENIYIANEDYSDNRTKLVKFHYEDGQITGKAAGTVYGYLNDSFSMNEYNGNLRVVTTYYGDEYNIVRDLAGSITGDYYPQNWIEHNAVYILDENLQETGAITGLAEGEVIRSARFLGDIGYFVTFRETDPLFAVDLSDPANPQIMSELELTGFSSYLHFYGEDRLLGIGYEADPSTGITTGLKLSMFDISDPSDVKELHRFTLPGITWCPAIENYKCILADPEKNIIGFFYDDRYMVFSYEEETGFAREMLYDFFSEMLNGQAEYDTLRGLYISDDFYLAGDGFLLSFDMNQGFVQTASVINLHA